MEPTNPRSRERREDLDRAKGLGILLVVFGHLVAKDAPPGNAWYEYAKVAVYSFHMPFFMYLSGYVTFLSGAARVPPSDWTRLLRKRAERLLVPFLIFGLLIAGGKLLASSFLLVDNMPRSPADALLNLVWHTDESAAHSVWYIAVLFIECTITPLLLWPARGRALPLLVIAALLYVAPVPHVMYLNEVGRFYIFFVIGGLAADRGELWLALVDRAKWGFMAALVIVVTPVTIAIANQNPLALFVCGVLSMPALHGLVRDQPLKRSSFLLWTGAYSFVIYLLNTPLIGVAKGVMWHIRPWNGPVFLVYVPVLMLVGVVGAIQIKSLVFRRLPALDRVTN